MARMSWDAADSESKILLGKAEREDLLDATSERRAETAEVTKLERSVNAPEGIVIWLSDVDVVMVDVVQTSAVISTWFSPAE